VPALGQDASDLRTNFRLLAMAKVRSRLAEHPDRLTSGWPARRDESADAIAKMSAGERRSTQATEH
jgi:hypothetical protein